jgi:hypothetical protein
MQQVSLQLLLTTTQFSLQRPLIVSASDNQSFGLP